MGIPWECLKRIHRRLFRLNDQIAKLQADAEKVAAELEFHRSINDDAQRDAAVGNYIDREEAGANRCRRPPVRADLGRSQARTGELVAKRDRLLAKLG